MPFYDIKSNIRLPSKQRQTPKPAYGCFRTVMSATLNQNDKTIIAAFYPMQLMLHEAFPF